MTSWWRLGKELFYTTPDAHVIGVELDPEGQNLVVGKLRQLVRGRGLGNAMSR